MDRAIQIPQYPIRLCEVNIIGDGNCLFRALSFLLYRTQEAFFVVKRNLISFIGDRYEDFKYDLMVCHKIRFHDKTEYVSYIS